MTLAEMNDELGAARTNKKEFLEKLERIIPWTEFIKLIEPHYYKGERGKTLSVGTDASQMVLTASSKSGCAVKICTGSPTGKAVGYAEIPAGGKMSEVPAAVQGLTGNQDLYFVFSGQAEMDCWIIK